MLALLKLMALHTLRALHVPDSGLQAPASGDLYFEHERLRGWRERMARGRGKGRSAAV